MSSEAEAAGLRKRPAWRSNPRKFVWALVMAITVVSLIFSVMAGINYTEIVKAKVLVSVTTDEAVTLTYGNGGILESVDVVLTFNAENPSSKDVKAWIFSYKGWIRDLPYEDGADISRWRIDGEITVNDTVQTYFPVFSSSYSLDSPSVFVPPRSNITIVKRITLNQTNYPDIMEGFQSILNYTSAAGWSLEWMHYTSSILLIQDIPPYSGPNKDANVIRRFEGFDITPGVGGAGS